MSNWWKRYRTTDLHSSYPDKASAVCDVSTVSALVLDGLCKPHAEWLEIGKYKVFLKSSGGKIDENLEVFIDLTGWYGESIQVPRELEKYLDKSKKPCKMVTWKITDGSPGPKTLMQFVLNMLRDGLTVGWGCMGGHGRTGWLAAKLYKEVLGCDGDTAVTWVRENYCKKAVETNSQLVDLGCTYILPTKEFATHYGNWDNY